MIVLSCVDKYLSGDLDLVDCCGCHDVQYCDIQNYFGGAL